MHAHRRLRLVLAALSLAAVAPTVAAAQDTAAADTVRRRETPLRLEGFVRDTLERPLRAAEVRAGGRTAFTDSLGHFRLDSLFDSPVYLLVRRIGYEPAATALETRDNVHRVEINVRLEPAAVQLSTVVVEGERVPAALLRTGYLQRKRLASGRFLDGEALEGLGGNWVAVLGNVPGVQLQFGRAGALFALGYAAGGLASGRCVMDVYLDGKYISWAREAGINSVIPVKELMAIEVHPRPTQVPSSVYRTGGQRDLCGAVLLWSKPFEPRAVDEP